eukprot:15430741-Alexandrium_andersonii.AAC.1
MREGGMLTEHRCTGDLRAQPHVRVRASACCNAHECTCLTRRQGGHVTAGARYPGGDPMSPTDVRPAYKEEVQGP